ncbi:fungal specific transcription factor domain-containing protein [Sarocladium implicatum]|nr:fungal specific transcription factor domain-containing protein [Sarocladium implicatum]
MTGAPGAATLSRRNLPRSSHACQRCRLKKAKCDQQQPCSNCIKYAQDCTYAPRRRTISDRRTRNSTASAHPVPASSSLPSPWSGHSEPVQRVRQETRQETPSPSDRLSAVDNTDVVGDVNQHTHGTEFYGTSSNFVLLNQFFIYARRQQLPLRSGSLAESQTSQVSPTPRDNVPPDAASGPHVVARPPLSIVNLLADEEVLGPPSRPKTPQQVVSGPHPTSGDGSSGPMRTISNEARNPDPSSRGGSQEPKTAEISLQAARQRLEREYIRQFLHNLHNLHPMLDPTTFIAQCERQVWQTTLSQAIKKDQRHFFALYNIVVAVGALVSGSTLQSFEQDIQLCLKHSLPRPRGHVVPSSQELSKVYFRKSQALLRNVFEVCSLESAQTLLLMSLYCQNSLKPHACYMYCGHAVRTALAIGIERESPNKPMHDRKAARRTWWCIYSHEIDMSCSAGRRDSLGKPRNYQIDLPHIMDHASNGPTAATDSQLESRSVAMINEMVHFAAILRRISKELYYDIKELTLSQKAAVAKRLDRLLDEWKDKLPAYLNFEHTSFRDEEWASKQRLVLQLRYLNAKIVLYRPFLEAHVRNPDAQIATHVEKLLAAARDTIRVMYAAYTNRHYFRTWWYNSTYTLYAGMIVLYIIMLDLTAMPLQDLLDDVTRAQEILESMVEAVVARRSANLLREGLEVARTFVQTRIDRSPRTQVNERSLNSFDLNDITGHLSSQGIGQDPALFASMVDPNLLQDFAAADGDMLGLDFSMYSFDGSDGVEMHTEPGLSFLQTP